jgi:histidinol-phosphate aminotransferase
MNRRAFVHTLSAGTFGLAALGRANADMHATTSDVGPLPARRNPADLIRIGGNENPYGPATSVLDAAQRAAREANRYAGPLQQTLLQAIAAKHAVPVDVVLLSGGSGDLLRASVMAFTSKMKALVIGSPSYEAPMRAARQIDAPIRDVALDSALRLDLAAMANRAVGAGLVYVCNPNNPSSTAVTASEVEWLVEKVVKTSPMTRIVIDEAYFEYADLPGFASATPLTMKYPQVIVVRTFSKIHAMAGMRAGYAIAQPKTLEFIRDHHSASGVSVMTMAAAIAALQDTDSVERNRRLNRETRNKTVAAFTWAGYRVADSNANFVFVNIRRDARAFQEACRERGIAIGRAFPPLTSWARISIGTTEEMETAVPIMLDVLRADV